MSGLPVTVIGGYLGAGKTTLVNHLLRHANGRRLAILVNDFGELPIDASLIEADRGDVIALSGGCVCCSYGGNLARAAEKILSMAPPPDHVLIETSGVALPAVVATSFAVMPGIQVYGTIVLADADQIRRKAANAYLADTILEQLQQADLIILTKTDLITAKELDLVTAWLRSIVPAQPVLPASFADLPTSIILDDLKTGSRTASCYSPSHAAFESYVLRPGAETDADALGRTLAADPRIERAKGYLRSNAGLALLNVVGHRYSVVPAVGDHAVGVVCIRTAEL